MATAPAPVSLAEYLNTEYEPDCDFVDGLLEDRNVGKQKHSALQMIIGAWLLANKSRHLHKVLSEQRVKVSPFRVRIPDICLVPIDDNDEVTQRPPALWIEVLSPEDRWGRIQTKLRDVLAFGVPMVWIVDPYSKEAWTVTQDGRVVLAEDGILRCANPKLEMPLSEVLPLD